MSKNQFQNLPSVSEVLLKVNISKNINNRVLTYIIKKELTSFRKLARIHKLTMNRNEIINLILHNIQKFYQKDINSIINGTGIILHTGFGRAPIKQNILRKVIKRIEGYSNLEFDLETGKRGNRLDHIRDLLNGITGSELGLMVNNNSAAVLLALNTIAENKEVIISRGQQVEIGGSFRIPDIIAKGNCILKEVGTTNRTHLGDYEKSINSQTGLLLWVHTSNYVVKGFTKDVPLTDLVTLGKKKRIPVMVDLGSGALLNLADLNLPREIIVQDVVKTGADVITFSGDKLLGGPQAGIVVGKNRYVKKMEKNPLYRAIRCGKFTLALMEETLKTYDTQNIKKNNLTLSLLSQKRSILSKRGNKILKNISNAQKSKLGISLVESKVEAGSGSLPTHEIESMALRFAPKDRKISVLSSQFRAGKIPVVGFTHGNRFYIDLKAVLSNQIDLLIQAVTQV